MMGPAEYVRRVLEAYRGAHGTCGVIRQADRGFALRLYERGVGLGVVENAMVLASARRLARPGDGVRLGVIRSLAYFSPVIDEVLGLGADDAYFEHLRRRLARMIGPS